MRPSGTEYFEQEVTEATPVLLTFEMPRYAVRLTPAIDAGSYCPPAGRNGERQPPFAVKYLNEGRDSVRQCQRVLI